MLFISSGQFYFPDNQSIPSVFGNVDGILISFLDLFFLHKKNLIYIQ